MFGADDLHVKYSYRLKGLNDRVIAIFPVIVNHSLYAISSLYR